MAHPIEHYKIDRGIQSLRNIKNKKLRNAVQQFTPHLVKTNYVKNFLWRGIPIIQYPTDMFVVQELIDRIRPDYVIETGMAFGGSLLFYADILEAIGHGRVIGIEIDPREHNMDKLLTFPVFRKRVKVLQGSSTDWEWIEHSYPLAEIKGKKNLVILDSHHTAEHVMQELMIFSPLVSLSSYIIVMDTAIEFYGDLDRNQDRPWGPGNSPWTAVQDFMYRNENFIVDAEVEQQALITSAPGGWLRRMV